MKPSHIILPGIIPFLAAIFMLQPSAMPAARETPGFFYFVYLAPSYSSEEQLVLEEGGSVDPILVSMSDNGQTSQPFGRNIAIGPLELLEGEKIALLTTDEKTGEQKLEPLPVRNSEVFQLVILQKDSSGKNSFSVRSLDHGNYPDGSFNILNLSTVPVAGIIHGQKFLTGPDQVFTKVLDLPAKARFDLQLYAQIKGHPVNLREGPARFQPGFRYFALILPSPDNGSELPRVEMIVENSRRLQTSARSMPSDPRTAPQ